MTKRQWFLVAGTLVLAACSPNSGLAVCETNDETGEVNCPGPVISDPALTPAPTLDEPVENSNPS